MSELKMDDVIITKVNDGDVLIWDSDFASWRWGTYPLRKERVRYIRKKKLERIFNEKT